MRYLHVDELTVGPKGHKLRENNKLEEESNLFPCWASLYKLWREHSQFRRSRKTLRA
jgi:hypothetical protein